MKLTIKEKIDLLKKVRESFFQDLEIYCYDWGICHIIQRHTVRSAKAIENTIPELLKHKPTDAGYYWFDRNKAGHEKRIEIINKTISDLENSLREIKKVYFKCNPENILLIKSHTLNTHYKYVNNLSLSFPVDFIKQNPDLFIVKTKDDILNDSMNDELYELQECCKESIPSKKNDNGYYTFIFKDNKIEIIYRGKGQLFLTCSNISFVRFDSDVQAIIFLYNIEKTENQELRNYFINLLKN